MLSAFFKMDRLSAAQGCKHRKACQDNDDNEQDTREAEIAG